MNRSSSEPELAATNWSHTADHLSARCQLSSWEKSSCMSPSQLMPTDESLEFRSIIISAASASVGFEDRPGKCAQEEAHRGTLEPSRQRACRSSGLVPVGFARESLPPDEPRGTRASHRALDRTSDAGNRLPTHRQVRRCTERHAGHIAVVQADVEGSNSGDELLVDVHTLCENRIGDRIPRNFEPRTGIGVPGIESELSLKPSFSCAIQSAWVASRVVSWSTCAAGLARPERRQAQDRRRPAYADTTPPAPSAAPKTIHDHRLLEVKAPPAGCDETVHRSPRPATVVKRVENRPYGDRSIAVKVWLPRRGDRSKCRLPENLIHWIGVG